MGERRHPFVDNIMNAKLPSRWRGLTIDRYDGSTDPDKHINVYTTDIGLYTTDRPLYVEYFQLS